MKTLFTQHKAIALFDCKAINNENAIRCHIYNLQNQLHYEASFVITAPNISTKTITTAKCHQHSIELECTDNTRILYNSITGKIDTTTQAKPKSAYWGKQLLRLASIFLSNFALH